MAVFLSTQPFVPTGFQVDGIIRPWPMCTSIGIYFYRDYVSLLCVTKCFKMLTSVSFTLKRNHTKTCAQTGMHVLFTRPGASNVWPGGGMSACPSLCPAYAFTPLLPLPALLSSSLHPLWALCLLPPLCLLKRTPSVLTTPLISRAFLHRCSRSALFHSLSLFPLVLPAGNDLMQSELTEGGDKISKEIRQIIKMIWRIWRETLVQLSLASIIH